MVIGSPHRQFCLTMILAADSCIERVLSKNMVIGSPHRQFCLTMIFLAAELHRARVIEKHG